MQQFYCNKGHFFSQRNICLLLYADSVFLLELWPAIPRPLWILVTRSPYCCLVLFQ